MGTYLRVYSPAKAFLGNLPQHQGIQTQVEHNDCGALTFTYPRNGVNANLIDLDDAFLTVVEDGVESPDWFLLEDDTDDDASADGKARGISVGGRGVLGILDRAEVWPADAAVYSPTDRVFTLWNPGQQMDKLLSEAKARSALTGITWSFTTTKDSAGVTWPTTYSQTWPAGTDLYSVVTTMAANGWADVRMVGTELRMYVPDTVCGVDRPNVILRPGKEVTSGPRKRSRRGIKTALLTIGNGVGESPLHGAVTDAPGIARYGRREGLAQQSVNDLTTLQGLGQIALAASAKTAEGFTLEFLNDLPAGVTAIVPGVDFKVGDFIRYSRRRTDSVTYEPLRARTIARTWDADGGRSTSVELNDLFVEANILRQRQIDRILGKSVESKGPLPTPTKDTRKPATPTGITYASTVYFDNQWDQFRGQLTISWTKVTTNADGTPDNGTLGYDVYTKPSSAATPNPNKWQLVSRSNDDDATTVYVGGLVPGSTWDVGVVAVDEDGNRSATGLLRNVAVETDHTAPNKPSAPILTSRLGVVSVDWNGKDSGGAAQPTDFSYLTVHQASSDGVTATTANKIGGIYESSGGTVYVTDLTYGSTYWFRFVAYDAAGNVSTQSDTASITVQKVVNFDVGAGQVGFDQLAFKQGGNLVPDGSFESAEWRTPDFADLVFGGTPTAWSVVGPDAANATDGLYRLRADATKGASTWREVRLMKAGDGDSSAPAGIRAFRVTPGQRYLCRMMIRATAGYTGYVNVGFLAWNAAGTRISSTNNTHRNVVTDLGTVPTTYTQFSYALTIPAGAIWACPQVELSSSASTGVWDIDSYEIRPITETALIDDAAITRAKIMDLAVGDAQIETLNVGKVTAGVLSAQITISGQFATALSGTRVTFDSTGIKAWKGTATTPFFNLSNGSLTMADGTITGGTVQTAASGTRLILDAAGGLRSLRNDGGINFQILPSGSSDADNNQHDGVALGLNAAVRFPGGTDGGFIMKDPAADQQKLLLRSGSSALNGAGIDLYDVGGQGLDGDGHAYSNSIRFYAETGSTSMKILSNSVVVLRSGFISPDHRIQGSSGGSAGNTTSTTFQPVPTAATLEFVGPPSGIVVIFLTEYLRSGTNLGSYALGDLEVKTGWVAGSGTTVSGTMAGIIANQNDAWVKCCGFRVVTGLTRGAQYHARAFYASQSGANAVYVSTATMTVIPSG